MLHLKRTLLEPGGITFSVSGINPSACKSTDPRTDLFTSAMVIILVELCPVENVAPEKLEASWQKCQDTLESMSSYIMAAQKCRETLSAMRRRASPTNSSQNTPEPPRNLLFTDERQMFTKASPRRPNLPPSQWKRIRTAPQKVEAKCTQRASRASEAVFEALRMAMCMGTAMSSLTTRSCETCCPMTPGRSRLRISRNGDGGMRL